MPEFYNASAIRRHALLVSAQTRAGKFTRVSEDFINGAIADVDNELRRMRSIATLIGPAAPIHPEEVFLTGFGRDGLAADFDIFVAKVIQRKVHLTRTGKTL